VAITREEIVALAKDRERQRVEFERWDRRLRAVREAGSPGERFKDIDIDRVVARARQAYQNAQAKYRTRLQSFWDSQYPPLAK
jgi:hypothetical protein